MVRLVRSHKIKFGDYPSNLWISARSASDSIAKLVALVQATWFTANTISRLANHYTVSPLEDLTITYVFCGLGMYLLWFRCPQKLHDGFIIETASVSASGSDTNTYSGLFRTNSSFLNRNIQGMSVVEYLSVIIFALSVFVGIHLIA